MKKGKYEYPMEFKVCKSCGCKEELVSEEFNARNPRNKKPGAATVYVIILADAMASIITPTIPLLVANVGICPKCGTLRSTLITETVGPAEMLQQAMQQMKQN